MSPFGNEEGDPSGGTRPDDAEPLASEKWTVLPENTAPEKQTGPPTGS